MSEIFKIIKIEDIVANPYQPRIHFNEKDLEELANSIKVNGLIQPIIVRQSEVFGYELIAGERRLKASKLAGLNEIPAVIKKISNSESMHQAIVENLQRSDLNPIEEARAFQNIIEKNNITHEHLAKYMGKSRPYISNSIRLLQLPEIILKAIEENKISSGHARALLALDDSHLQEKYFNQIIKQHLNVRQTESLIKSSKKGHTLKREEKNIFIKAIEEELAKTLGITVQLSQKKDGSGTLQFHYQNTEELNRVINKLK